MRSALLIPLCLILAGCPGLASTAETVAVRSVDLDYDRRSAPASPGAQSLEAAAHAYTVAPDRALISVSASLSGEGTGDARAQTDAITVRLIEILSEGDGCSAAVVDAIPPRANDDDWGAQVTVQLDADLRDLADVEARRQRVASCTAPLLTLADDTSLKGARIGVSIPLLTIDDPQAHRTALLKRQLSRLGEVAALADDVPQFDPSLVQCTSGGTVTIAARSLAAVTLAIDFTCTGTATVAS